MNNLRSSSESWRNERGLFEKTNYILFVNSQLNYKFDNSRKRIHTKMEYKSTRLKRAVAVRKPWIVATVIAASLMLNSPVDATAIHRSNHQASSLASTRLNDHSGASLSQTKHPTPLKSQKSQNQLLAEKDQDTETLFAQSNAADANQVFANLVEDSAPRLAQSLSQDD